MGVRVERDEARGQSEGTTIELSRDALRDELLAAVRAGDSERAQSLGRHIVGEAAIELLEDLTAQELALLFTILGEEILGDLIAELDPHDAARVLSRMTNAQVADLLEVIDPDDATDIVEEIEPITAEAILIEMQPEDASEIRTLLAYPSDSAGGIMTPAFVSISPNLRADQAVVALRRVAEDAETVNYVYVQDEHDRLLGVLSLHNLVLTRPDTLVRDLMIRDIVTVPVEADREVAARLLVDHGLLALPVVDHEHHLLGIITSDDVAEVLEEEATEDFERLGGSQPLDEPYLRASPALLMRKRVVWLIVLFFAQAYTGSVMSYFSDDLESVIALSLFIPMLIGIGGNVGSQVVTTIIRAMALGELRFRDTLRILRKEFLTAIMLGLLLALLTFGRALLLPNVGIDIGLTVAITVTAIVIWAGVIGAVLPLLLRQLRVDPAVVSAPFITTLVDGTGLMIYFMTARLLLGL
jgi:magnesium transporter